MTPSQTFTEMTPEMQLPPTMNTKGNTQIKVSSISIPVEYYDMSADTPPNTPSESYSLEALERKMPALSKPQNSNRNF